jgi:type I restriction enzyme S subunit
MNNHYVTLGSCVHQYRDEIWVDDAKTYGQITVSNTGTISHRGTKTGGAIGRKRQFVVNLKTHPNTLIFTRQGIYDGAIGFAPSDTDGCIATENMPLFSLKAGISREYIEQLLLSPVFKNEVKKLAPKGAAQKSIHERELLEVSIPLPFLESQIAIADSVAKERQIVSSLQHEITHQQSLLAKLKQAILQEAIAGKLTADWRAAHPDVEPASQLLHRIQAEKARLIAAKKLRPEKPLPVVAATEIPFEIPAGWEWSRLGSIALHSLGKMLDKGKNKGNALPYLRNLNVRWYGVELSDLKTMPFEDRELEKYSVGRGDVLICEGGHGIGRAAVWDSDQTVMFQKALHRVRFIGGFYEPTLFVHFLRLSEMTGHITNYFTGAGIPHFTGDKIHEMAIPLPPLAEQAAIVERVEALMTTCRALEAEIEHARTHAAHLLQAVLKEAFAPAS